MLMVYSKCSLVRRSVLSLVGVSALALEAAAASPLEEGYLKLDEGEPRAAMIRFEQALRANPDDMAARLGLSQALVRMGAFERAEKMARVVQRRAPSEEVSLVLAEALFGQSKFDEAKRAIGSVADGADAQALRALMTAEEALLQAQPAVALQGLGPALDHDRLGRLAQLSAARAQYMRGDLVRARRLVETLTVDGDRAIPALTLRARLALRSGDPARAKALADDLLAVDPSNVAAGAIGVEAALRAGDKDSARAVLATLEPQQPNDPRPAYLEALILLEEGKVSEAATVVGPIEPWLTGYAGGATLLAEIKQATGRTAQAETILRERLARAPGDSGARQGLVTLYRDTDKVTQASEVLEEGLALTPADPGLLQLKAQLALANGQYEAAEAAVAKASGTDIALAQFLGSGTNDVPLLEALAALQGRDTDLALAKAQRAVVASPGDPLALNLLAAAQARAGDTSSAKATLDGLIAAHPDFLAAILNRASLNEGDDPLRPVLEAAREAGAKSEAVLTRLAEEHYVAGDTPKSLALIRGIVAGDPADGNRLWAGRLFFVQNHKSKAVTFLSGITNPTMASDAARLLLALGEAEEAARLASLSDDAALRAEALRAMGQQDDANLLLEEAFRAQPTDAALAIAWLEGLAGANIDAALQQLNSDKALAPYRGPVMEARLLSLAGKDKAAWAALDRAPKTMPSFAVAATLPRMEGQTQALIKDLVTYTDAYPTDLSALLLLSGIAVDVGDKKRAEAALAAALTVSPGNPFALNNLALARRASDPEGALALAERAFRLAPQNPSITETYADFLKQNGNVEKARRLVRRARLSAPLDEGLATWAQGPR